MNEKPTEFSLELNPPFPQYELADSELLLDLYGSLAGLKFMKNAPKEIIPLNSDKASKLIGEEITRSCFDFTHEFTEAEISERNLYYSAPLSIARQHGSAAILRVMQGTFKHFSKYPLEAVQENIVNKAKILSAQGHSKYRKGDRAQVLNMAMNFILDQDKKEEYAKGVLSDINQAVQEMNFPECAAATWGLLKGIMLDPQARDVLLDADMSLGKDPDKFSFIEAIKDRVNQTNPQTVPFMTTLKEIYRQGAFEAMILFIGSTRESTVR